MADRVRVGDAVVVAVGVGAAQRSTEDFKGVGENVFWGGPVGSGV